jgi:site-specific recombinase XerD
MLEEGISIHNVKALADHRSITTTLNYYTALNINKLREELENVKIFDNPAS